MAADITPQQDALNWMFEQHPKADESATQRSGKVSLSLVPDIAPPKMSVPHSIKGEISDAALILQASKSPKFVALMSGDVSGHASASEADLALTNLIAYYSTHPDQIDRIFRQSGLYREKWDTQHGAQTYGQMTLDKALAGDSAAAGREARTQYARTSQHGVPVAKVAPIPFNLIERMAHALFVGKPAPVAWLIERIFPRGKVCLLVSPPGVGKSMLALQLAMQVASVPSAADPKFSFGGQVRAHGRVVVISAEDDEDEMHRRLDSLRGTGPMPEKLHIVSLPDLGHFSFLHGDPRHGMAPSARWAELKEQIIQLGQVQLIVVDTLQAMSTGDLNAAEIAQSVMNELTELANQTGASVLVLHHLTKGTAHLMQKDGLLNAHNAADAIRGSGAIVGSSRVAYCLLPHPHGDKICEEMGVEFEQNKVVYGLVAKANGDARRDRTIYIRDERGLLQDRTYEYWRLSQSSESLLEVELFEAIVAAHLRDDGFACSVASKHGLHKRRHELPAQFHQLSCAWFAAHAEALVQAGKLLKEKITNGFKYIPVQPTEDGPGQDRDRDDDISIDFNFGNGHNESGSPVAGNKMLDQAGETS